MTEALTSLSITISYQCKFYLHYSRTKIFEEKIFFLFKYLIENSTQLCTRELLVGKNLCRGCHGFKPPNEIPIHDDIETCKGKKSYLAVVANS